jgi:hypothetical protein
MEVTTLPNTIKCSYLAGLLLLTIILTVSPMQAKSTEIALFNPYLMEAINTLKYNYLAKDYCFSP